MIRRDFLKTTGLVSLSPLVPGFVNELAASTRPEADQKILVVIELSGGNDGINTVVPFSDEAYGKHRKKLKLPTDRLHKLNDSVALNPSMRPAKELFDSNQLAIVQGVGYPNPNRSHFESMAIWHAGMREGRRTAGEGWLGAALDHSRRPNQNGMDGYFVGRQSVSPALVGRRAQVAALSRFADLKLNSAAEPIPSATAKSDISSFVQRQVTESYATARRIESVAKTQDKMESYPSSAVGRQMQLVSQLIKSGSAARVYYTTQGGYDTHSAQLNTHANLLYQFSTSLKAFVDDLKQHELDQQVVIMAFSEFGRRVAENGSLGTDHGTAGPIFLAGTTVSGGLHGRVPSLIDLDNGDLKTQFDFRQLYATLLDRWLEIPSVKVLGQEFELLPIL